MKSPFLGMDPYLEDHWGDVHASIAIYARNQLRSQLPSDLKVRVEEYIAVEDVEPSSDEIHHYVPDVRIVQKDGVSGATMTVAEPETESDEEPLIVPFYVEPPTQREIRIFKTKEGGRLITAIIIFSPTNMRSGRRDYRRKQEELLAAEVNLVEIDLQRRGPGYWPCRKSRRSAFPCGPPIRTPGSICKRSSTRHTRTGGTKTSTIRRTPCHPSCPKNKPGQISSCGSRGGGGGRVCLSMPHHLRSAHAPLSCTSRRPRGSIRELGEAYDFDPPKKRRLAIKWYLRAAAQGHPIAQNLLGESYRDGWSVRQDKRKAVKWFRLAAQQGVADAQLSLGAAFFYGEGVKQNRREALRWYRKAAKQGNASALLNIGHMLRLGEGVRQSWSRAIRSYQLAAAKGNVAANALAWPHLWRTRRVSKRRCQSL
jgi:hypothetical protein